MSIQSASHEQEERSGRIGQAQQDFLDIFREFGPLTSRQAIAYVEKYKGRRYQQRCGRIAELTNMGFLELYDVVLDDDSNKRVNRWNATHRTTPLPMVCKFVECKHCEGRGGVYKSVYQKDPKDGIQLDYLQ